MQPLRKVFQKNPLAPTQKKKSYAISLPVVGIFSIIFICVIGWSFYMGFMVGRGQNPQKSIQEMTGLSLNSPKLEKTDQKEEPVIKKEEEKPLPPKTEPIVENNEKQVTESFPFAKPVGKELDAWKETSVEPQKAPEKPVIQKNTNQQKPVKKSLPLYNYTFQVAAVKSSKDAENLAKNLTKAGLRASSKKSGKVYTVIVALKGYENSVAEMNKILQSFKLKNPLRLSKKPVAEKAKK